MATVNSKKQIFLDESKETPPLADFVVVETEIEFLQNDGAEKLWVRGQLCDYARVIYQARKINVTEVVSPRTRLRGLIGETAEKINSLLLEQLSKIFERESPKTLSELLFHFTHDDFWSSSPSTAHAARFLIISLNDELAELADAQRKIWLNSVQNDKLSKVYKYKFQDREKFLHDWFFNKQIRESLGEFPLRLTDKDSEIVSDEIGRQLRSTDGAAVIEFPKQTPNKEIYAKAVLDYFSHNTTRLTADYIAQVSSLLSSTERARLERILPQTELAPLDISVEAEDALRWVTEKYLPFRVLQTENSKSAETDALANTFADWTLENYPKLTSLDRETSPINLRTFYTVKNLLDQNYWVLWAVIDGLSYENHQKLLQLLGEKSAHLRIAENSPLFAVLPTITEKAKYGLTTGKFPQENTRRDWSTKSNFLAGFPDGVYAGSAGTIKISEGLKRETPTVCYWNYLNIDDCFHDQTDLSFIKHEVDAQIQGLAGKINQLVSTARDMNKVAVVICSDHGQMTSSCRKLNVDLTDKHAHGRTALDNAGQIFGFANSAFVKTNNGETAYLNPTSFRLSEPTTVALGSTYFVDLKANETHGAIGVHGGLYPEEVVVGMAVLMRQPTNKPLTVVVSGAGETGRNGKILLSIDNPNAAPVNPLTITIENLEASEQGELLLAKVSAHNKLDLEIPIDKFPAPTDGDNFDVIGILRYEFEDGRQEECKVSGNITCKSLYSAKNPSLLNRFKK